MMRTLALLAGLLVLATPAAATAPFVDARAFVVEDGATGEVIAQRASFERVPIASITKLMTVLVVLDRHKLTDTVTVDARAAAVGESRVGLRAGERITIRDLIKAALIQSANDAADALALATAPDFTSFAALMNAKASALGLGATHFVRPDGLDAPGHLSSAHDVTLLARDAMRLPFVRATVRERTDTISGGRSLHTWNDLLSTFPHVIGVKTGHTGAAGWSQVAAAQGQGVTVYATILGGASREGRNTDLRALLAYGLAQYRIVPTISAVRTYATVELPYGRAPLALVAARPMLRTVRVERPLTETVVAAMVVSLPVHEGQVLGHVEVRAGRRLLARSSLVASRSVHKPGVAGRVGWVARRTIHHLAGFFR